MIEVVSHTNYSEVKLMLYDLNNDFSNCLKLLMSGRDANRRLKFSLKSSEKEIDGFEWLKNRHENLD